MGSRQHFWICLVLSVLTVGLLLYALLLKAGNIVDTKRKRIGFYNICLWNESAQELECYDLEALKRLGIVQPLVALVTIVCMYATLPLCLFALLSFIFARCAEERSLWHLGGWLVAISFVAMTIGLGTFLLTIWALIQSAELNYNFSVLVVAYATLLLQGLLVKSYEWHSEKVISKQEEEKESESIYLSIHRPSARNAIATRNLGRDI